MKGDKDMKLRKWVKVTIAIIVVILLVLLVKAMNDYTDNAIDNCVKAGNSRTYCERALAG